MSNLTKGAFLKLYRDLIRTSLDFPQYNYKKFFVRRIRDHFETIKNETDPTKLGTFYQEETRTLETLRRQVLISKSLANRPLVIEQKQ
uniref:Complex1_LYR_dom domain-containing protein n=1 Tax=Parastrongyloides trichosuri TaxID=131310 RepID=A0A0N5A2H7_PARTI